MRMLPALYKLDSKGKKRVWTINANDPPGSYTVSHGIAGGKQQSTTVAVEQKNIGRSNETSLEEQAELEARAIWNQKQDKGYTLLDPLNKGIDGILLLSAKRYLPMLAKSFKDDGHKIEYPCYFQPKLDGIKCLAYLNNNNVILLSRKGKIFEYLPHIEAALLTILRDNPNIVFDGELYNDSGDFQKIVSIVRKQKGIHPDANKIEYHIYDYFQTDIPGVSFKLRTLNLDIFLKNAQKPIVNVETGLLSAEKEVAERLLEYEQKGYEGIMLRNAQGIYEQDRRSPHLQKVKTFMDDEFLIVDAYEGIGKFSGMCTFVCRAPYGNDFGCMPKGTEEQRREYWINKDKYIGKKLTVKYFGMTNDGIPRFPVGIAIRSDYE